MSRVLSGAERAPTATAFRPLRTHSIPGIGRQWFNNNGKFTNPATGTFGNCSPQLSGLRSPHYTDVDLSLHKDFPLTERFRLQFRTDFINAFNHVQYNAPNMSLGIHDGTDYQCPAPEEHTAGAEALLLKNENAV